MSDGQLADEIVLILVEIVDEPLHIEAFGGRIDACGIDERGVVVDPDALSCRRALGGGFLKVIQQA